MARRAWHRLALMPVTAVACSEVPPPSVPQAEAAVIARPGCFWDQPKSTDATEVAASVERLMGVTDMPYICGDLCAGGPGCGDALFWSVVRDGRAAIPYLVAKLGDATSTEVSVPNFGGKYAVGDVALQVLEVIVDVPHEDLVGVEQSAECGECAWWYFVRASRANRELLERRVREYLTVQKWRWVWREPTYIPWLDCAENCEHPAGGSFALLPNE